MIRILLVLAAVSLAPAQGPVIVIDGDTLRIDSVTIRIVSIDAPESYRSRCEAELIAGLKAKARLRQLLDAGPVAYAPSGKDRYGRTLARVWAGSRDVGEALLAEGLALPWQPGPAAKAERLRHWCPAK